MSDLAAGSDGAPRCSWHGGDPLYEAYHDAEWGRPVRADDALFERVALEGFQAGLSWITILRKREAFREAFAGFDIGTVASFGEAEVAALLENPEIVRNRAKVRAAVSNARRAADLIEEVGSLEEFLRPFADWSGSAPASFADLPARTPASERLARELKGRGWTFVGPTTMYALMQSIGLVNDHLDGCFVRAECEAERTLAWRPPT